MNALISTRTELVDGTCKVSANRKLVSAGSASPYSLALALAPPRIPLHVPYPISMSTHNSNKLLEKTLLCKKEDSQIATRRPTATRSHFTCACDLPSVMWLVHVTIPHPHSALWIWSLELGNNVCDCALVNSKYSVCYGIADNLLERLAEKWPIILKNWSMLRDTYNAQKMPALFIWA